MDLYSFNASPEEFSELIIRAEDLVPRAASGSSAANKAYKVELLLRSLPNAVNLVKLEICGLDQREGEEECYSWGDNERQRLADSLNSNLPKLRHLRIVSSLGVAEKTATNLASALSSLSGLQLLDLSLNNLGINGAELLAPALERLTSLQHLDLSYTGLDYKNAVYLGDADFLGLSALLELRSLNLSGNCLHVNGTTTLVHAVIRNPLKYLLHLDLSDNAMGVEGAAKLAPALKGFANSLQHLDLSYNGMGPGGVDRLVLGLGDLGNSLQHLNLGGNSMGNDGAAALAPVLRSLRRLEHLDLGANELGWKGAAALAPAVRSLWASMLHLDLGDNFNLAEEAEGVAIMAPAIKTLWQLQHLDLSNTGLGFVAGGAAVLAPTLGALRCLKHLNLSGSALGIDETIALFTPGGPTVSGLSSLQHLDIGENGAANFEDWPAGREGALEWAASLKNDSLRSLKYLTSAMDLRASLWNTSLSIPVAA